MSELNTNDETSYFDLPAPNPVRILDNDETTYYQLVPSANRNFSNRSQTRNRNRNSIPRKLTNNGIPYISTDLKNCQDSFKRRIIPSDLEFSAENISGTSNILDQDIREDTISISSTTNSTSEEDDWNSELGEEKCTREVSCPGADYFNNTRNTETKNSRLRCPGTLNLLTRRMIPCDQAPTLREIALGRRIPRPIVRKMPIENDFHESYKRNCTCNCLECPTIE